VWTLGPLPDQPHYDPINTDGDDSNFTTANSYRNWHGPPCGWRPMPGCRAAGGQAVTACLVSLPLTWMLRGLAASRTGMVRVSTPAA
jgi:hypothetical protein